MQNHLGRRKEHTRSLLAGKVSILLLNIDKMTDEQARDDLVGLYTRFGEVKVKNYVTALLEGDTDTPARKRLKRLVATCPHCGCLTCSDDADTDIENLPADDDDMEDSGLVVTGLAVINSDGTTTTP